MHLDKGNRIDEALREKFESYPSEIDPKLWDQVLDKVERGDRNRGLFLSLGSFLIAMMVLMGSNSSIADGLLADNSALPVAIESAVEEQGDVQDEFVENRDETLAPTSTEITEQARAIVDDQSAYGKEVITKRANYSSLPQHASDEVLSKSTVNNERRAEKPDLTVFKNDVHQTPFGGRPLAVKSQEHVPEDEPHEQLKDFESLHPVEMRGLDISNPLNDLRGIHTPTGALIEPLENVSASNSRRFAIEFLIGPSLNYRTFEAENSAEFTTHKNESDRSLLSTNGEILIHYSLNGSWMFSAGVGKMNMGENYSYTLHEQTHNFKNEYHFITIPLKVRHRIWDISNSLDLYAGLGIQYGFLQEGTSSWVDLNSEQAVTHSNKGADSPFREEVSSGELDLMLRADLSQRIFVSVQERGSYGLSSIYKKETGLDQRQFSFDTLVGIGIRF